MIFEKIFAAAQPAAPATRGTNPNRPAARRTGRPSGILTTEELRRAVAEVIG